MDAVTRSRNLNDALIHPMNVRVAQIIDLESISAIAQISFPLACPPESKKSELDQYMSTNLDVRSFQKIYQDTAHIVWVAENNSQVVGFCVVNIINSSNAKISKIYVLPEHHGSGVAAMLIETAISLAKAQNIKVITLSVFSGNKRAKKFYNKFGFEFTEHVEFQMGREVHKDDLMKLQFT